MPFRIPKRFSLRTMLRLVAVIASAAYIVREHYDIRFARERYVLSYVNWDQKLIPIDKVIESSEQLARDETDSVWISVRTAEKRHVERMNELVRDIEGCFPWLMQESSDLLAVKRNIREHCKP
jgi:hypothetical protein